jgi:integrase-like protein
VAEFKAALMANGMVDPRTVAAPAVGGRTFRQVATEYAQVKEARVVPSTVAKYRENWRLHVYPVIGHMDINEIRPSTSGR